MIKIPSINSIRESLRSSLWFLPALIILGAIALALVLIEADSHFEVYKLAENWPRLFGAGAQGARGMLEAIASSMITVAGVAFSITVVALTLASSQYTSRILRNFMRDRANQAVLGILTGVFAYCIVVLRTIRDGNEVTFVPSLAVLIAVAMALVGIGCLIFFIHHIALSIQAEQIIRAAAMETFQAIDRLFPEEMGNPVTPVDQNALLSLATRSWQAIPAIHSGFLQGIESEGLLNLAQEWNVIIRMECGIGEFVAEGATIVSLGGPILADSEIADKIDSLFEIGAQRTMVQDVAFGIRQIVDVALKALSPGINDSTTAVICVNYLGAIVGRLALREFPTPYRMKDGAVRVVARSQNFAGIVGEAFDQIRQNAGGNVAVLQTLLMALESVSQRNCGTERQQALKRQIDLVAKIARASIPIKEDCQAIEESLQRITNNFQMT